MAKEDFF